MFSLADHHHQQWLVYGASSLWLSRFTIKHYAILVCGISRISSYLRLSKSYATCWLLSCMTPFQFQFVFSVSFIANLQRKLSRHEQCVGNYWIFSISKKKLFQTFLFLFGCFDKMTITPAIKRYFTGEKKPTEEHDWRKSVAICCMPCHAMHFFPHWMLLNFNDLMNLNRPIKRTEWEALILTFRLRRYTQKWPCFHYTESKIDKEQQIQK